MTTGFGILGAGMISALHADALKNSQKAELVAVCDVQQERAEKLAGDFAPNAKVYTKFDDMLADPNVAVVNVVTPNHLHTDAVLACAAAGKHVLCEKPPAMSLKDTDRMIEACRQASVKFGGFVSGVADSVVVPVNPYIYSGQLNITTHVIYTSGTCVEECPE